MSTSFNPFSNNNNGNFTNNPSQSNIFFGNKTQTNSIINGSNDQSKKGIINSIFNQKIDSNPFNSKMEPNSNNFNIRLTQDANSQKNSNPFIGFNTEQNKEIKNSNDININQNIKNNTLLNISSINNNNKIGQNSSNIFNNNNQKGINNLLNNTNNDKEKNNNILSTINTKEEKKDEKNILISQSNNILNKSNNIISINNNQNKNDEQIKNSILPQNQNQNPENKQNNIQISNSQKKENPKVNEFINNLFAEDKIIFTEEEKKEFEKKQLSHKLNEEILNEFELMLLNQKEKFKKFGNNSRIFGNKYFALLDNIKNISTKALNNESKYKKLLEKIKLTEAKVSKLNLNMINKNASISGGLDYLKKNLNDNNNILSSMVNTNFEKNNPFYKELNGISDKMRKIDNNINIIWNSINKNQENKKEINYSNEKEIKNKSIKIIREDNNYNGIFVEINHSDYADIYKDNNNNEKIYVEQKDINNIFSECYDGLYSLKNIEDEINNKYTILKNKLDDKINESKNIYVKRNIENEEINL